MRIDDWFLTAADRGNPATRLDSRRADGLAWSTGNEGPVPQPPRRCQPPRRSAADPINRRSWTHDSELNRAVLDLADRGGGAGFARALRYRLSNEHLGVDLDPDASAAQAYHAFWQSAAALDAWHANGRCGPRPPGQLRHYHAPDLFRWQRVVARPLYRFVYDPDGRPHDLRRRGEF